MFTFSRIIKILARPPTLIKTPVRRVKLQPHKQYVKRRKSLETLYSNNIYLKALGTGATDQPSTALLFTPDQFYLFNCCENSGRYFYANGVSPSFVRHVFVTQSKWNAIGGLTSIMFHALASIGQFPQFHGPKNLFKIIQRMTFLSIVGGLFKYSLKADNFNENQFFEDDNIRVDFIELTNGEHVAYSYVCKVKAKKGRFSLEKSIEKNVPANELLAKIVNGEDVTLADGTVVRADEVRQRSYPDKYFMIVDVPSMDYLPAFVKNERIDQLLKDIQPTGMELIVHFTPKSIFNKKEYQSVIGKFNAQRHSLMNDSNDYSALPNVHRLQDKLHSIDSELHPLLSMRPDPDQITYDPNDENASQYDATPRLYTKYVFQDASDKNPMGRETVEQNNVLREALKEIGNSQKEPPNIYFRTESINRLHNETFPRFVFFGTGSASSMYNRNSSGILVHTSNQHSILLDCGEGICSQIHRYYGYQAPEIFRRIKAVYVSHMHLDHHIGLPELFRMRQMYMNSYRPPLIILCPYDNLKSWLNFYSNHIENIFTDVKMIPNCILQKDGLNRRLCKSLGIHHFKTCNVNHNDNSTAVTIDIPFENDIFKLTYSGDTEPCDSLVNLAQDSTLLIHEATFQDELVPMAREKRHSTISQAIEQAQKSNALFTILTHFSARYGTIPYIKGELPKNIGIAFDNMEVTLDNLPQINRLYPRYLDLFQEQIEFLEKKTRLYKMRFC